MNEPPRLRRRAGISQRLLDSASLDKPSEAARRRAEAFAGTASAFTRTATGVAAQRTAPRPSVTKTLVTWAAIGAAASGVLAFAASQLFDQDSAKRGATAAAPAAELPSLAPAVTAPPTDIAPEVSPPNAHVPEAPDAAQPAASIIPWVPSPTPTHASLDEVREIVAARNAVSRGDNSLALATLDRYDQSHPNGALEAESTVLRVQALSNSGKTAEAKRLANAFAAKNPSHPLTPQLQSIAPR